VSSGVRRAVLAMGVGGGGTRRGLMVLGTVAVAHIEATLDLTVWKAAWVAQGLRLDAWAGWPRLPHFRQAMEQAAWEALSAQLVEERRCSWEAAEKAAASELGLWYWTLERRRRRWTAEAAGARNGRRPDVLGDSDE